MALAAWELAWVDAGAAACSLSGSLAHTIIRDYGTREQRDRYLERPEWRHGALCLTELLPGAGAEALLLAGTIKVAERRPGGSRMLAVEKRGRFTSHMDFADFVLAAVAPGDRSVHNSCLVLLEPSDPGLFDRGAPTRKLGHQLSSTTNPAFSLRVSPDRVLGGCTIEEGILIPRLTHGEALSSALRRARTVVGLMSASKLLSAVEAIIAYHRGRKGAPADWSHRLVDIWAAGEASASLGFASTRLSDELDAAGDQCAALEKRAGVICSCAKLFATSHAAPLLQGALSLIGAPALAEDSPGFLGFKCVDAMVESLYLGPESLQRRQISASIDDDFLSGFAAWTDETNRMAATHPETGAGSLAAGMELWRYVFNRLKALEDGRGVPLYSDVNQGTAFAMADALCLLAASRALLVGLVEVRHNLSAGTGRGVNGPIALMTALGAVQSARAAGVVAQICTQLLFGCRPRNQVSREERRLSGYLRSKLEASLCGVAGVRDRAAESIRALASA
jgi:alkylation response protein AidB-like acyl-CoA dehydrogenase